MNRNLGALDADKAAAVAVLNGIHELVDVTKQQVDVVQDDNRVFVIAADDIDAKSLLLPPCVPRQSKVFEKTEHPYGVRIKVQVMDRTKRKVKDSNNLLWESDFVVLPEFKAPLQHNGRAARVPSTPQPSKEDPTAGEDSSASPGEIVWVWGEGRAETMHPFWAVRRLTPQQLDKEVEACIKRNKIAVAEVQAIMPSFNCELEDHTHSSVNIATVGLCVLCTRTIKVPYLTNSKALAKGEELILPHVVEAKEKQQVKRTWRDVRKDEMERSAKAKRVKD